jgi:hypothetical protein
MALLLLKKARLFRFDFNLKAPALKKTSFGSEGEKEVEI